MTFDDFIGFCAIDPDKILKSYSLSGDPEFELEWKRKYVNWARYVANMSLGNKSIILDKWCENNLTGRFNLCTPVYFEFEKDLVLFLLRWG